MYEHSTLTTFVDTSLPMLPGQVSPAASTSILRIETIQACTETVTFERIEFAPIVPEEPEVSFEDLRTMILERPQEPYTDWSKARLYKRAKELGLPGRSKLGKAALRQALIAFEGR